MKLPKLFIFFILISCINFYKIYTNSFDQNRLDRNAVKIGYGYKTSNLMELENLVKSIKLNKDYKVAVPDFVGITSKQIKDFFIANGLNIQKRWEEIISSVNLEEPLKYLKNTKNREKFIENSESLASEIEELKITEKLNLESVNKFLNKASMMILRASKPNLKTFPRDTWRLMVRSTGKEDTKDLPNAGGNHSEPNVDPDVFDVTNAIKKVVASYFKAKSLNQRIDAGDKDIFADPLTPVLLQRMIGEKIGGAKSTKENINEIPVGCVVYTGEVEGQTPGVVTIQGAFGHNEGVVNSEVAVDTFYVKNGKINSVLQVKNQRIIPAETGDRFGLLLINNEDYLKNRQVLNDETILEINIVANDVNDYYDSPQDIELVYEPSTKTIYLVQTRPLQIIKSSVSSYIVNLNDIPEKDIAKCATVSAGGGALRFIKNKKEIITAITLEEALNIYLYGGIDQNNVLVVIVKGNAEPTSHAAAIFRGVGKAILTCDDIEKVEKWIDDENKLDLLVDVQRESIVNVSELINFKNKNLQELTDSGLVRPGWFKHPISQRLSISGPAFFGPLPKPDINVKKKTYKQLIEILKDGEEEYAEDALTALMWKLNDLLYKKKKTKLSKSRLEKLRKVYNVATRLSKEILESGVLKKDPKNIERLYPINFLEAVLFQPEQTKKYVNVFSVDSVSKEYKAIKGFIKKKLVPFLGSDSAKNISENIDALSIMKLGVDASLTEDLEKKWISFVNSIMSSNEVEGIERLNYIFTTLRKLEILPMWINTIFANESGADKLILKNLFDQLEESDVFLKIILEKKNWLDNFDPHKFDDPNNYVKQLSNFKTNIKYFISDEYMTLFKDGSLIMKEVGLSFMDKVVDVWDKSIKELKASTKYEISDKVKNFRNMLEVYFDFLKSWVKFTSFDLSDRYGTNVSEIFKEVKDILSKRLMPSMVTYNSQLSNSEFFNVAVSSIGRKGSFRYGPKTLEDVFTFIHQSLLNIISIISKDSVPKILFPEWVENYIQKILNTKFTENLNIYFYGYRFTGDDIVVVYNLPIRTHSIVIKQSYNKKEQKLFFNVLLYGENTEGRWFRLNDYLYILSNLSGISLKKNLVVSTGIEFTMELIKDIAWTKIQQFFDDSIDLSFDEGEIEYKFSDGAGLSGFFFLERLYNLFNKKDVDRVVVNSSLKKNRINWLFPFVLINLTQDEDSLKKEVEKIVNKLSNDNNYKLKTMFFISKILVITREKVLLHSKYNFVNYSNYNKIIIDSDKYMVDTYYFNIILNAMFFLNKDLSGVLTNLKSLISRCGDCADLLDSLMSRCISIKIKNKDIKVLTKIFELVLEFDLMSSKDLIKDLVSSEDSDIANIAIDTLKKSFDFGSDIFKQMFINNEFIETLIGSGYDNAVKLAVEIVKSSFISNLDDLMKNALSIIDYLTWSDDSEATEVSVNFLNKVFESGPEKLKENVENKFGEFIKEHNIQVSKDLLPLPDLPPLPEE